MVKKILKIALIVVGGIFASAVLLYVGLLLYIAFWTFVFR